MNLSQPVHIPEPVIDRAIQILSQQRLTPLSPGRRSSSGRTEFCAAAALAVAGLKFAERHDRLRSFEAAICESGSAECVREAFRELGWSLELCDLVQINNDCFETHDRTESVIRMLGELRSLASTPIRPVA